MNDPTAEIELSTQGLIAAVLTDHQWHHTSRTHCACGFRTPLAQLAVEGYIQHVAAHVTVALTERDQSRLAALRADAEARAVREVCAALDDHPITEYGTTRCPNEGWLAAEIDDEDGTCSACGEQVKRPASTPTTTPATEPAGLPDEMEA